MTPAVRRVQVSSAAAHTSRVYMAAPEPDAAVADLSKTYVHKPRGLVDIVTLTKTRADKTFLVTSAWPLSAAHTTLSVSAVACSCRPVPGTTRGRGRLMSHGVANFDNVMNLT